ncbi:BglG family transcription antiterminator [Brevibacillus daliensis]|uniref:BglG family transcription antiterminator n=1 Tax=Brevibacillus daliensis TaxID=2892995 RepID=UPI001E391617|nr:BglG family transcription antiterminator [Brevibacillus daliensis]
MRDRYTKILHILQNSNGFVTGTDISEQLHISSRTVVNDIKDLNENYLIGALIVSNKRQGYRLKGEIAGFKQGQHIEFEDRGFYIIKILLESKELTTYEQLSQLIYFSPQTIRSDIQRISQMITSQKRNLAIEVLPFQGIRLEGDELDKRLLLESLFRKNFMTIKELHLELSERFLDWIVIEEIEQVITIVIDNVTKYMVNIPPEKLSSLVAHLIIAVCRIRQNYEIYEGKVDEQLLAYEEYDLASKIIDEIEEAFQMEIGSLERYYFCLHLMSQRIIVNFYDFESSFPHDLMVRIKNILKELGMQYGLHFHEDRQLLTGLLYHLTKAQYPLRYQLYVENPFISHIKMEYLLAYHISVLFAHSLEMKMNFFLPESEIAYISLHIAAHIERTKRNKGVVAIVSGSGVGTSIILKQKIQRHFLHIEIDGVYSLQMLDKISNDVMLIVSTIDVEKKGIPVVRVNEFLDETDLEKIEIAINQGYLDRALSKERFILLDEKNKQDILVEMTKRMNINHMLESIFIREEMSSTEIGNFVAMPHPIERFDIAETMIFVAINKKPVLWGNTNVQLVFLILPGEIDRENHYKVFNQLYQLVKSKERVQEIVQATDFHTFMEVLH